MAYIDLVGIFFICNLIFEGVRSADMATAKKSSWVWEYFSKLDTDCKKVKCSECSKLLSYQGTTSNLADHLRNIHHVTPTGKMVSPSIGEFLIKKPRKCTESRQQEIVNRIVEMIIVDLRPLSCVEVCLCQLLHYTLL